MAPSRRSNLLLFSATAMALVASAQAARALQGFISVPAANPAPEPSACNWNNQDYSTGTWAYCPNCEGYSYCYCCNGAWTHCGNTQDWKVACSSMHQHDWHDDRIIIVDRLTDHNWDPRSDHKDLQDHQNQHDNTNGPQKHDVDQHMAHFDHDQDETITHVSGVHQTDHVDSTANGNNSPFATIHDTQDIEQATDDMQNSIHQLDTTSIDSEVPAVNIDNTLGQHDDFSGFGNWASHDSISDWSHNDAEPHDFGSDNIGGSDFGEHDFASHEVEGPGSRP